MSGSKKGFVRVGKAAREEWRKERRP